MRKLILSIAASAAIASLASCSKTQKIQVLTTDTHLKMVAENPDGIALTKGDTVHLYTSSLVTYEWKVRNDGFNADAFKYSAYHCMAIVL